MHRLNNIPWLFLISKTGLEMNMPYTLSNYIVINEKSIKNLSQFNEISDNFVNTLIHEKIHIIQRINQAQFNEFYAKRIIALFIKKYILKRYLYNIEKYICLILIVNKDFWLYRINNKVYYPILIKRGSFC